MAKDFSFPFYFRDFLASTDLMTNEQVGAHVRILCHQADKGHLHEDSIRERIREPIWDAIRGRYRQDQEGLWYHPRMEAVLKERSRFVENRLKNLHKGTPCGSPIREPHVGRSLSLSLSSSLIKKKDMKIRAEKPPVDPRYRRFVEIFDIAWKKSERQGKTPIMDKDGKQLKALLSRQPEIDDKDFTIAVTVCDSIEFHAKNFSLAYICANFEKLINLEAANGKNTGTNPRRFVGEFEKESAGKYEALS